MKFISSGIMWLPDLSNSTVSTQLGKEYIHLMCLQEHDPVRRTIYLCTCNTPGNDVLMEWLESEEPILNVHAPDFIRRMMERYTVLFIGNGMYSKCIHAEVCERIGGILEVDVQTEDDALLHRVTADGDSNQYYTVRGEEGFYFVNRGVVEVVGNAIRCQTCVEYSSDGCYHSRQVRSSEVIGNEFYLQLAEDSDNDEVDIIPDLNNISSRLVPYKSESINMHCLRVDYADYFKARVRSCICYSEVCVCGNKCPSCQREWSSTSFQQRTVSLFTHRFTRMDITVLDILCSTAGCTGILRWDGMEDAIFTPSLTFALEHELLYIILDSITYGASTYHSIHKRIEAAYQRRSLLLGTEAYCLSKVCNAYELNKSYQHFFTFLK